MNRSGSSDRPRPAPPSVISAPGDVPTPSLREDVWADGDIQPVHDVLADLALIEAAPLSEHVARFTSVHERLERILREPDST